MTKKQYTEEERMEIINQHVDRLVFAKYRLKAMGEKPTGKTEGEAWERRHEMYEAEVRRWLRKIERQAELIALEY